MTSFISSFVVTKLYASLAVRKLTLSNVGVVITVVFAVFLLSANPFAVANVATAANCPTPNCATGLEIEPACLPTSNTPFFARPFNSSLTP